MTRVVRLRPWQKAALDRFVESPKPDFLAVATPGAGKTTFALTAARHQLAEHPGRLVVVAPTAHLKQQWARAAAAFSLHLDPSWSPADGALPRDMHGVVTSYQQVASSAPLLARVAQDAFVVFDELHHAADDRAWGGAIRDAFGGSRRRLALSGTPFRSDTRAIPFVTYRGDEAVPDYEYGYADALRDGRVVRPVYFPRMGGEMEWSAPDGTLYEATFDDPLATALANQRLRTALSPDGEWLHAVLRLAIDRLAEVRRSQPDAGGLVIAIDQDHARDIATLLRDRFRRVAVVVTSDDPSASERIGAFAAGRDEWLVAVRMVSEGVDIPRLRVGVYATAARTELFFRQVVGRFIRATPGPRRQMSYLLMPADSRLKALAHEIELERRHALDLSPDAEEEEAIELDDVEPERGEPGGGFAALSSGDAELADAIMSETALQLFPTDDPKPVAKKTIAPARPAAEPEDREPERESAYEARERLRNERKRLVGDVARRTNKSHREIQARVNRDTRVRSVANATIEQLERGNAILRRELWR
jgi:superfamily II DNA or RNA helicase